MNVVDDASNCLVISIDFKIIITIVRHGVFPFCALRGRLCLGFKRRRTELSCLLEHAFNCIAVPGSKFDGFGIAHRIGFEDTLEMITGTKMVEGNIGMNIIDVVVDAENRDGGAVKICLVAASRQIDFKKLIFFS